MSGFRLSPWHIEIARRIAAGKSNREIRREIQISESRLSVIKANPLFKRQVEKFKAEAESKWKRTLDKLEDRLEKAGDELVQIATTGAGSRTQLEALRMWFEMVGRRGGEAMKEDEEESFEVLLRATRRGKSSPENAGSGFDYELAAAELAQDELKTLKKVGGE